VVATPPASAPAAGAVRLRPDAGKQVEALAKGTTTSAGEPALSGVEGLAKRGWEAYQRGDVESALTAFIEAADRPDVRPWVLYALGLSHAALARPADAAAAWERVRAAAPEFEAVYIDLADAYLQMAEASKALAVLREAEQRWPADTEVLNAIGVIHVRRGALDEAVAIFARATEAAPDDALGHFNLAKTYEMRFVRGRRYVSSQRTWVSSDGDREKAQEGYQRVVKLGGPYAQEAADAISRLNWSKK
jgi:tetratricopeptide (TPR) repeat protein